MVLLKRKLAHLDRFQIAATKNLCKIITIKSKLRANERKTLKRELFKE